MKPAMIRPNVMMPKIRTRSGARSAVMTTQPTFSEIAAATRRTHRATKNAIAFWRRVMRGILGIQNAKLKIPLIPVYTKKGV